MTTQRMVATCQDASYRIVHEQGCAVVVAAGEIDLHAAPELRRALDRAAELSGHIVVDLTDVDFMDSSGLGVVLRARSRGHLLSVSLVQPPHTLRKVLEVTSLCDVLPVHASRLDAIDEAEQEHPV